VKKEYLKKRRSPLTKTEVKEKENIKMGLLPPQRVKDKLFSKKNPHVSERKRVNTK